MEDCGLIVPRHEIVSPRIIWGPARDLRERVTGIRKLCHWPENPHFGKWPQMSVAGYPEVPPNSGDIRFYRVYVLCLQREAAINPSAVNRRVVGSSPT